MRLTTALTLTLFALPAAAEETRQLDAHEHGQGALNIAVDGDQIAIELEAPGFDIVGFEHPATSDTDKAAIEAALATLSDPTNLLALPEAAGCTVTEAAAELITEEDHDDHEGHDEHDEHGKHDDHHDEHEDEEDHAEEEAHDDHDDHGHESEEASHTEFHAEFLFTCSDVASATTLSLSYFETFANAEGLEVQFVSGAGAVLMDATPEAATLDLTKAN